MTKFSMPGNRPFEKGAVSWVLEDGDEAMHFALEFSDDEVYYYII